MTHTKLFFSGPLVVALGVTAFLLCGASATPPGLQPYTPTRLQWAALELQALYGNNAMTHETPLMITFNPWNDGVTIKCLMQYTGDYPAAALKAQRDSVESVFKMYVASAGWPWLKLSLQERPMDVTWPHGR
jgi:hypothetical protein